MGKLLAILIIVLSSTCARAATHSLASCSQSEVSSAIVSAAAGDTIQCPAGTWSWSDIDITKDVTIRGAGIGSTRINIAASFGIESPPGYLGAFRLTGFTFASTANFGDYWYAMLSVRNGRGWRIDNNEFQIHSSAKDGSGGNGLLIEGDAAGLIDHNRFVKGSGSGCVHAAIQISNSGTTSTSLDAQKYSWLNFDPDALLGSSDHTVFVEDNYFFNPDNCAEHNSHAIYTRHGGVVVFRHNEIHGFNADVHPFDDEHGGYVFEISNNTWVADVPSLFTLVDIAAGTGVIYGNSLVGSGASYGIQLLFSRATGPGAGAITSFVSGFGTVSARVSCGSAEGYPCAEQPGRGRNNSADPIYIWNNTGFPPLKNSAGSYVQAGRDYFMNQGARPGYVGLAYPHPLQRGSSSLPAPTNLRVTQ